MPRGEKSGKSAVDLPSARCGQPPFVAIAYNHIIERQGEPDWNVETVTLPPSLVL